MTKRPLTSFIAALFGAGWYVTALLLVLSMCMLLVAPWVNPPDIEIGLAAPVSLSVTAPTRSTDPADASHVHLEGAEGSVYFSPRRSGFVAGSALVLAAFLSLALFMIGQLRALFRTLRDGHPFVAENATRIRRLGWAIIASTLAWSILQYVGSRYASTHFVTDGILFAPRARVDLFAIVSGLIVLAIAQVFREGTRLDEDQSLTV